MFLYYVLLIFLQFWSVLFTILNLFLPIHFFSPIKSLSLLVIYLYVNNQYLRYLCHECRDLTVPDIRKQTDIVFFFKSQIWSEHQDKAKFIGLDLNGSFYFKKNNKIFILFIWNIFEMLNFFGSSYISLVFESI